MSTETGHLKRLGGLVYELPWSPHALRTRRTFLLDAVCPSPREVHGYTTGTGVLAWRDQIPTWTRP
jgi:hypothetical protein